MTQITYFDPLPNLPKLRYLNLRKNGLVKWEEIEKIKGFLTLEVIIISFNPFINDCKDSYIYQILSKFNEIKPLKRINKHEITMDLRSKTYQWVESNWKVRVQKEKEEREKKEKEEREREERDRKDADR